MFKYGIDRKQSRFTYDTEFVFIIGIIILGHIFKATKLKKYSRKEEKRYQVLKKKLFPKSNVPKIE